MCFHVIASGRNQHVAVPVWGPGRTGRQEVTPLTWNLEFDELLVCWFGVKWRTGVAVSEYTAFFCRSVGRTSRDASVDWWTARRLKLNWFQR